MGVGGQDGFIALAKEVRRAQREQAAWLERRQERVDARRARQLDGLDRDTGPVDALVCPRCERSYPFGDNCPRCGKELVCSSVLQAEQSPTEPRRLRDRLPALSLVLACTFALLVMLCCAGAFSGWTG
jgi:uncharacterized protein YbaR (Trm112 family)